LTFRCGILLMFQLLLATQLFNIPHYGIENYSPK
jgi:hypothetical protein